MTDFELMIEGVENVIKDLDIKLCFAIKIRGFQEGLKTDFQSQIR